MQSQERAHLRRLAEEGGEARHRADVEEGRGRRISGAASSSSNSARKRAKSADALVCPLKPPQEVERGGGAAKDVGIRPDLVVGIKDVGPQATQPILRPLHVFPGVDKVPLQCRAGAGLENEGILVAGDKVADGGVQLAGAPSHIMKRPLDGRLVQRR